MIRPLHSIHPLWHAGVVLAYSNSLAGRLSDLTVQRGLGGIGCFLGGATACVLAMAALALFCTFGDLGRDDAAAALA
jgi:hypothetical protein